MHRWGHRSTNGVNNVFGAEAEVYGKPDIRDSRIASGQIFNSSIITDSTVAGSVVIGPYAIVTRSSVLGNSRVIDNALIENSTVSGNAVICGRAQAFSSDITDNAKVYDNARVQRVRMFGDAIVCGTAIVSAPEGVVLDLGYGVFLDRGLWHRAPLLFHTSTGRTVVESSDNLVNIGCVTNTSDKWLGGAGDRYGRLMGMSKEEIDEVRYYVEILEQEKKKC